MEVFLTLFICVIIVLFIAYKVACRGDKARLIFTVMAFLCIFMVLLHYINKSMPFAGGGDDYGYYKYSLFKVHSISEWLETDKYIRGAGQGGYNQLLTGFGHFCGKSLYARKALNIFFYVSIGLIWYAIGKHTSGIKLARLLFVSVMFMSPLWYYFLFLLKDMTIALLQSMFLLSMVLYLKTPKKRYGILLTISIIATVPFRIPFAIIDVMILIYILMIKLVDRYGMAKFGKTAIVLLFLGISFIVYKIISTPEHLHTLSVNPEAKYTLENIPEKIMKHTRRRSTSFSYLPNFIGAPLLFFTGGTGVAALTYTQEESFTATSLNNKLAFPWLAVMFPFFIVGLKEIAKDSYVTFLRGGNRGIIVKKMNNEQTYGMVNSLYLPLISYVGAFFIMFYFVGSAGGRYQISALAPMVCVAIIGWNKSVKNRAVILTLWWLMISLYMIRGILGWELPFIFVVILISIYQFRRYRMSKST